jgi:hypothetical protein
MRASGCSRAGTCKYDMGMFVCVERVELIGSARPSHAACLALPVDIMPRVGQHSLHAHDACM